MIVKILIILLLASIVWAILKWTVKFIGGIWGIKDEKIAATVGTVLLGISCYIMYSYGEKGILLFGTILVLIFLALKHLLFTSSEKLKQDDDKNYNLIKADYDKGLSSTQIATSHNFSLPYVDETIRKFAFDQAIMAYYSPKESAEELASKFNLPLDYVSKWLNWRISGGKKEEPIDPIMIFYLLLLLFFAFKIYGVVEPYVKNVYLSYIISCISVVILWMPIIWGYLSSPTAKKIFTWIAYSLLLGLIGYQIYLLK